MNAAPLSWLITRFFNPAAPVLPISHLADVFSTFCKYIPFLIGTLIGGQLRSVMSRTELFRWTAFVTIGLGLVYYLMYYLIARRYEKRLIEKLNAKYPQRFKKTREIHLYYPEEDVMSTKL